MLKVIQVKIQEHISCRKKNLETAWFDRSKNRLDRSKHGSVEFLVGPNNSSSPLRIRVSDLLFLVYKGNSKHIFISLFRERRVCLLYI